MNSLIEKPPMLQDFLNPRSLPINATKSLGIALEINEALPNLSLREPTALILDSNNLYLRLRDCGWMVDYAKLYRILTSRCDLRYSAAYSAIDPELPKSENWIKYMRKTGYTVFTSNVKRFVTADRGIIKKGNLDIEITIGAMELAANFEHIILGTCDGDFVPLVKKLKEGNFRKVSVLGVTKHKDWTGMSRELAGCADNFYDLNDLRSHLIHTSENTNVLGNQADYSR